MVVIQYEKCCARHTRLRQVVEYDASAAASLAENYVGVVSV